jgi:nucleoside 2-deoxyribosyltransferase
MPLRQDVFFIAMRQAAEQVRAVCERVDRREFQGSVVDEIQRLIRQSVAVIVDLSEAKPNVLYEAGYAHALNKPCIHICSTSTEKLPSMSATGRRRCIIRAQTHKLAKDTRLIEN